MNEDWRKSYLEQQERMYGQLVQIKLLLVIILLLLLLPVIGVGPIYRIGLIGLAGLATIYLGLWTFERLVKRKIGHNWSDAQLASFIKETDSQDSRDSTPS